MVTAKTYAQGELRPPNPRAEPSMVKQGAATGKPGEASCVSTRGPAVGCRVEGEEAP